MTLLPKKNGQIWEIGLGMVSPGDWCEKHNQDNNDGCSVEGAKTVGSMHAQVNLAPSDLLSP